MTIPQQLDTDPTDEVDNSRWLDGTWIQTISGRRVSIAHPRPEDLDVDDIAWALSRQVRYNGHVKSFYTVAQHCVLVSNILAHWGYKPQAQFVGLMHDAPEAYIGDLIRPVKVQCPDFKKVEDRLWVRAFVPRFDLPATLPEAVKRADNVALLMERRDLCAPAPDASVDESEYDKDMLPWVVEGMAPPRAREAFLEAYGRLAATR